MALVAKGLLEQCTIITHVLLFAFLNKLAGILCLFSLKFFFDFLKNLFLSLLAVLGLRCCVQAFSSCGERGLLFVAVCGLLIAVASLVAEHGL